MHAKPPKQPDAPLPPLPNSYWVTPGMLLAGEYPGDSEESKTHEKITRLLEAGIQVFIDLTWKDELASYVPVLMELVASRSQPVFYCAFPIRDFGVPTHSTMKAILDCIDWSITHKQPVYLHCWGGVGRTGTVVGCYLVRHGASGPEALERLNILRLHTSKWWRPSPETEEQCAFVLSWHENEPGI
jgi:hypothetical protein